jgi:hypothetical protein
MDTNYILQTYSLPDEADVRWASLGVDYEYNNTNYRLNPVKGNRVQDYYYGRYKKIKKNNDVLDLKNPSDPSFDFGTLYDTVKLNSYQIRIRAAAAKYFRLGRQNRTTFKTAVNGGYFQSENTFRNELFQIGGYKLLRGFDEESQYFRGSSSELWNSDTLLDKIPSFMFFPMVVGAEIRARIRMLTTLISVQGLACHSKPKSGFFNIAWAVGKRNDLDFNLRSRRFTLDLSITFNQPL